MTTLARALERWFGIILAMIILSALLPRGVHNSVSHAAISDGWWLADGYGLLLEIGGDTLRAFEVTSLSCLPSWSGRHTANDVISPGRTFTGDAGTVHLSAGTNAESMRMRRDGTVSDIVLRRISPQSKRCIEVPENIPQANYAIFWQTFAEQYPFFELRHIDWRAMDDKWRPQVTLATTPLDLFRIFRKMIEPLQDAHTGLVAPDIHQVFDGTRDDPNHSNETDWKKVNEIIESRYLFGNLKSFCRGHLQFGVLGGAIGYFQVTAFFGYVDTERYGDALEALKLALDTVFSQSGKLIGLVIDLRLNRGGDDALGLEIASRLANKRYLAYAKAARLDPQNPRLFTVPQQVWVVPSTRPGFRGGVVLLIGPDTVSAGETFTMALMGRDPHVTRVGLNTQGVFSDVLSRRLPNGWRFRLPNEIYFASDGRSYDGLGVPPEIRIAIYSKDDFKRGRDSALEGALKIINSSDGGLRKSQSAKLKAFSGR